MSKSSGSIIKPGRPGPRAALLPAAIFLAFAMLSPLGAWRRPDRWISDRLVKARISYAPLRQSPRIYSVDLTDSAERNLGDRLEDRQAFAELLGVMADGEIDGGLDFLFQKARDPAIDERMAQLAARIPGLALAVVPVPADLSKFTGRQNDDSEKAIIRKRLWHPRVRDPGAIPLASTFILPVAGLAGNAAILGHIAILPDDDGLYRRIPLFYRWEDGYLPAFALALAARELKVDPSAVEIRPGSCVILPLPGGRSVRIPVDRAGAAVVPYPSLWAEGARHWPLDKVAEAAKDPAAEARLIDQWRDGLVLAADLTTAQKDFVSTPVEAVYPLSGLHSSLLSGILTGTFYSPLPELFRALLALVLAAAIAAIARLSRATPFHLCYAALFLALAGLACLLWFRFLILPWFAGPALGLAAAWLAAFGLRLLKSREQRLLLESALNRYFSPTLTARVLAEKNVDLVPVQKELTVLFADIAGFTRWSSDKSPELVHVFLTDYLESMSAILFRHGGTIDKFMGDGILAFFGDPLDQTDHAARALRAAIDMQRKAAELSEIWLDSAGMDLKIRIGVNTGPVIVGNLGSRTRIEYTVIGAAVNMGQRMESNAPVGSILVSESSWSRTKDQFEFGEVLSVKVKGYEAPVPAYVLGRERGVASGSA